MKLTQMKCPNCSANLDVENGIDSFFCKYCGTKILLEGQSQAAYTAKTINNVANRLLDQREEKIRRKEEERRRQEEAARRREESNRKTAPFAFLGLFAIAIISIAMLFYLMSGEKKEIASETAKLEATYAEIQADISQGNYTDALLKANTLHFTGSGLAEKRKWDSTRESVIAMIENLQNPNATRLPSTPHPSPTPTPGIFDNEGLDTLKDTAQEFVDTVNDFKNIFGQLTGGN